MTDNDNVKVIAMLQHSKYFAREQYASFEQEAQRTWQMMEWEEVTKKLNKPDTITDQPPPEGL